MAYTGEQIDIQSTLGSIDTLAVQCGFFTEPLLEIHDYRLKWYHKESPNKDAKTIYMSAGVHGDEPAGVLAVADMFERGLFSEQLHWVIVPMVNPSGLARNTRENAQGIDINRDFKSPRSFEAKRVIEVIESKTSYDLALLLHEDWESQGFYLYDIADSKEAWVADKIVEVVAEVCPIDLSEEIDEMPAQGGIIRPDPNDADVDPKLQGEWAEALYIYFEEKAKLQYTFEAPSAFEMDVRVKALSNAVLAAVNAI